MENYPMALKKRGTAPAKKSTASAKTSTPVAETAVGAVMQHARAKLTISVKRRLPDGSEVFLAPGLEQDCAPEDLAATYAELTEQVNTWMDTLLEAYPDSDPIEDEDEEAEDDDEDDEDDDGEAEDEDGEDDPTEEEILKMNKKAVQELAAAYEIELEETVLAKMRKELIEALFAEDDEDDEDDEDGEAEDEDGEAEDGDLYDEDELKTMKLDELQEIVTGWEMELLDFKKGTKLPAKKAAYIKHILEAQEEE
jgi:hypothetical protein